MKSLLLYLLTLVVIISCKKSESSDMVTGSNAIVMDKVESANAPMASEGGDSAETTTETPSIIEQKIIKEGNLRFETTDLNQTYGRIVSSVRKHQGIIQNDVEGKDYESLFRNLTVRIPSKNFDQLILDIGKGVSYFDRKEISARDVTEEYVDIDARLKAKKVLEVRYLELLKKAGKVSEMLEIETQLASVREEIESMEGKLKYMQSRVSMSTVNIEFYKKVASESGVTASYGTKMWNAIKSGFNNMSAFFIGLLYLWPFIIILVVLIYFLRKRFGRKKTI